MYPWEKWDSRLDMVIDNAKIWCIHIGGKIVKEDNEKIEIKLPENLGLLRIDSNGAFVTGLNVKNSHDTHKSPNYEMRVFGVKNMKRKNDMYKLNSPPKNISITIDETKASSIEIHGTGKMLSKENKYIKVEFYKKDDDFVNNWSSMSSSEIKKYLNSIPDSNHKKMLKNELEKADLI